MKYLLSTSVRMSFFACCLLAACATQSQLPVGTKVPEFKLLDQNGKEFDITSVLGSRKLVIYFYPKDDSPGCTRQACYFRDQFEVFREAGADIIGISAQSVDSHKKFAEKYKLTFTLLSDTLNTVRKQFGIANRVIPGRVTFVIDKTGTIKYVFDSQTQVEKHVDEALRILKEME